MDKLNSSPQLLMIHLRQENNVFKIGGVTSKFSTNKHIDKGKIELTCGIKTTHLCPSNWLQQNWMRSDVLHWLSH